MLMLLINKSIKSQFYLFNKICFNSIEFLIESSRFKRLSLKKYKQGKTA